MIISIRNWLKKVIVILPFFCCHFSGYTFDYSAFSKIFIFPLQTFHALSLGSSDAQEKYQKKVEEFLKNHNQTNVVIKKLDAPRLIKTFLLAERPAFYVGYDGIWLDEEQLASLKETELIFECAYAATAYAHLKFNDGFIDMLINVTPYIAAAVTNMALFNSGCCSFSESTESFFKRYLKNSSAFLSYCLLPYFNYQGIKYMHEAFTKPTLSARSDTRKSSLLRATYEMLRKNGYGWVIDDLAAGKKDLPSAPKLISDGKLTKND